MSDASVLYDIPGPKQRRRVLVASVVAGLLVLALVVVAVLRLEENGQFEAEKWSPLFNPNDEVFTQVWSLLWDAFLNTLSAAALSMALSLFLGTLMAVARLTAGRYTRIPVVGVIELLRGVPVVIAIFFAYQVLPELGLDTSLFWYLVVGLVGYNSVIIAEIVRAGVVSLPRGQAEAAYALGLTRWQALRLVQLPQAFRVMLPALISQLVVIVKDTSLGAFIGYSELLRQGGLVIQNLRNPIQTYLLVAVIFILLNYALSRLARWVERRLSRSKTGGAETEAEAQEVERKSEATTGA